MPSLYSQHRPDRFKTAPVSRGGGLLRLGLGPRGVPGWRRLLALVVIAAVWFVYYFWILKK